MMSNGLWLYLLAGLYACASVIARPTKATGIKLEQCNAPIAHSVSTQCATFCQVVANAHQQCTNSASDASCICTAAPALDLHACLTCQTAMQGDAYTWLGLQLVPSRLTAYAQACKRVKLVEDSGSDGGAEALVVTPQVRLTSPRNGPGATPGACLYGLPSVNPTAA
ncbi:hypothetical protein FA95DRAFT_1552559 [Auriscalpium vulgare]|uniref:Uncharacterized protein n=1 Tax=Auriscalpium vulgare TaxID=40419 RepID=A0ACB8SAG5_9AGAM|nr:hypothetical protein FA95DRAFT_1552559 [Auriscalpium vulgare]